MARARVHDRAALESALARAPAYIVVRGGEALRANAARLAYRGGQEAAWLETAGLACFLANARPPLSPPPVSPNCGP